jgi:hypothetical protein
MASFNLNKLNGSVTFIVNGRLSLKDIVEALEEALSANRNSDALLKDTGILDDHDFYSNELHYCRTERIILKLKRALPPYALDSSSRIH